MAKHPRIVQHDSSQGFGLIQEFNERGRTRGLGAGNSSFLQATPRLPAARAKGIRKESPEQTERLDSLRDKLLDPKASQSAVKKAGPDQGPTNRVKNVVKEAFKSLFTGGLAGDLQGTLKNKGKKKQPTQRQSGSLPRLRQLPRIPQ